MAAAAALILAGCGDSREPQPAKMPEIKEISVDGISYNSATVTAVLEGNTEGSVCGFAVALSGSSNITEYESTPVDGTMVLELKSLSPDTEYCVRAFIDNGQRIRIHSEDLVFRTEKRPVPPDMEFVPIEDPEFKKWLLVRFDTDQDGELSSPEARSITTFEIKTDNIYSLKGIEYLTNLKSIDACGTNNGNVSHGKLTEVDLSNNLALEYVRLNYNQIHLIKVNERSPIWHFGADGNLLENIPFESLPHLRQMGFSNNPMRKCDLSGLDELDEVHLDSCLNLEEVQLDNKVLRYFSAVDCSLRALDVSKCPVINVIDTHNNVFLDCIYVSREQAISIITKDLHTEIVYVD